MNTIRHITPVSRIFCGPDSLRYLPAELKRERCARVLIFCDPFLIKEGTLLKRVQDILGDSLVGIFSEIEPGSPVPTVQAGAQAVIRAKADALVVVGGGSSVVTSRGAVILAAEQADPHDICTSRGEEGKLVSPRLLTPKIPMFVIPTTPITAMVKGGASILDPDTNAQLALFDPKTRGKSIFIHPDFIKTIPERLLMSACMSTMAAAIDGLLSTDGDILSDALLIHSLRILYEKLSNEEQLSDPRAEALCEIMLATVLCGMGSDYTGFGISVVMGHAITAFNRINAGFVNGVMIPHTLRYNRGAVKGMKKLASALGIPTGKEGFADEVCRCMEKFLSGLEIPHTLREMGMNHEKIEEIAQAAMDDWYLHYNPVPVGKDDVVKILKAAW